MIHLIPVSGPGDPVLEIYTKPSEVQLKRYFEPHGGLFIAESPKVVMRALDAGCEPISLLMEEKHVAGEAAGVIARCRALPGKIPVYIGRYEDLIKITGYALTRGVLCAMRRPPLPDAEKVMRAADRVAVLENVANPANVGAIFRNAAALGMDAVLLTPGCSDPLYRRTLRVSMGTVLQIPWAWIGNSPEDWAQGGLSLLRRYGYRTAAMALREDSVELEELCLNLEHVKKVAVLLGAEGDGLLPETIADADDVVRIPMGRGVDSLNVAAASAIAFYAVNRQVRSVLP